MTMSRRDFGAAALMLALSTLLATTASRASAPPAGAMNHPALKVVRAAQALFVSVVRAGDRLVAVGERGLIVLSDDNGASWRQADVPASVTLTTVRFANAREGWAAGHQGVILRTRDGGATWTRVFDGRMAAEAAVKAAKADPSANLQDAQRLVDEGPDKPFLSLAIQPDGSLLAIGAFGLAFESRDGGASWSSQMTRLPNPDGFSFYGLAERPGQRLLFGEQGTLLASPAQSSPFQKAASPTDATLFGSLTVADGSVLLMGLRGKVFRSARPDAPWESVQTPIDASLFSGAQLRDGRILLVGAAGQVLVSSDAGRSFRNVPLKRRFPFSGVVQAADGSVVLAGVRGLLRVEPADFATADAPAADVLARTPAVPGTSSR